MSVPAMPSCIDRDRLFEVLQEDETTGFCIECGAERDSCEPDARQYQCPDCGMMSVYGAEELCLMYADAPNY